jgi:ABC-2 type transport system ATP-binding protein
VSFDIAEGQTVALLGPNGAGKSTFVRILSTLLVPNSGRATVCGFDVVRQPEMVRSVISLTGQSTAVDEYLTGEENLRLVARLWRVPPGDANQRTRELLDRFELAPAARKPVRHYSGGMRRKLDLALSLMVRPRVLLLDEPTTGLDPRSRLAMWEIVEQLNATGVTVLLTTQYLEEADRLASNVVMIDQGRIVAQGTPAQLKRNMAGSRVLLQFADDATRRLAANALGPRAHWQPGVLPTLEVDGGTGTDSLRELLNDLATACVPVDHVSLHEPTLDDVFLALTGNSRESAEAART